MRRSFLRAAIAATLLSSLPGLSHALSGVVFRDYDGDNVKATLEPLVGNAVVTAYGNNNTACGSAVTTFTGATNFSFTPSATGDCNVGTYRVEFTVYPFGVTGFGNTASGTNTSVQFLAGNATGVVHPARSGNDYCSATPTNPTGLRVASSRHFIGSASGAQPTLMDFSYLQTGDPTGTDPTAATQTDTGALYGMAWQRSMRRLYASAYMRRHVGSNTSLGRIYRVTRNAANNGWVAGSTAVYADLEALFPGAASTDPRPGGHDYVTDNLIFDQVGKRGIGDMAISEDDNTLYVVALGDRRLYQLPADALSAITSPAQVAATTIPRPASCAVDTDFRPFGLGIEGGDVYVGAVCSGQSSATTGNTCRINGDRSLLRGYVLRFRPGTGFDATPVFDFPLNYPRADVDPAGGCLPDGDPTTPGTQVLGNAMWNVWSGALADTPLQGNGQVYPQPMLVEIAFDRGDLILGFRDRLTDQGRDGAADLQSITGGEFLRACKQADGSFQLESNGSCTGINGTFTGGVGTLANSARGPGTNAFGGEVYPMDHYSNDNANTPTSNQPATFDGGPHDEVGAGALTMVPGNQFTMGTFFDPWNEYGSGGVRRLDNTNLTAPANGYEIYDSDPNIGFYKATALGDIEPLCDIAPRIIGNRVWTDADLNGRQDPTEAGVAGQTVELYSTAGQLLGRTTTDANGNYAFVVTPLFSGSDADVTNNAVQLTATTINGGSFYVVLGSNVTTALATTAHAAAAGATPNGTLEGGIGDFRDSDGSAQSVPNVGSRVGAVVTLGPANNITSVDFGVRNGLDFGDLPDTGAGSGANNYETLLSNGGPRHTITPTLYLGSSVDAEADGFNTAAANGDDGNNTDDEDAVPASGLTAPASSTEFITLTLLNQQGSAARLCVFTDWNADGDFGDASEAQFFSVANNSSGLTIGLTVPAIGGGVVVGNKFQRYRLLPTGAACAAADNLGAATAGEVEDYVFALTAAVSGSDFGDLPNGTYLTSGAGAASHTIVSNLYLGVAPPDSEATGAPNATATGDDIATTDDEDSVPSALLVIDDAAITPLPITLLNNTGANALLCVYVDYNSDGDFGDAGEGPLGGAITSLAAPQVAVVNLGANASTSNARLRVRLTNSAACDFNNALGNGEVEDYILTQAVANNRDFGDLPDTAAGTGANNYETLLANTGPRHNIIPELRLGALNDAETDGVNSPANTPPRGDDTATSDDEDGISESVLFVPAAGGTITFPVAVVNTTGATATLCTFVDTNENGGMGDIVLTTSVPAGATSVSNSLTFAAGANAQGYVRFRLLPGPTACASPGGTVGGYSAGEVEDYRYYKGDVDFGDAPDTGTGSGAGNYQTTELDNGAAHRVIATLGLGATVDGDDGTVQGAAADGDDATGAPDDEDAIAASALTVATSAAISIPVTVRNTTGAAVGLCGLLDINGDGVFANTAAERSFVSVANNATSANLSFSNAPATPIVTYLRVRISSQFTSAATCLTAGIVENGEVEDYRFTVGGAQDFGDLPATGTYQTGGQAAHTLTTGLYLGVIPPDSEGAPASSTAADGDNLAGSNDEEGIPAALLNYVSGHSLSLPIGLTNATASSAGVCAYVDLNGDGDFVDGGEVQFSAIAASSGTQTVWASFGAVTAPTPPLYARIRLSQSYTGIGTCSPLNAASSGEVEDYALTLTANVDYGDLNTAAITQNPNGARHGIIGALELGALNDAEANGVPSATATGDDAAGSDDEDGVTLSTLRAAPTLTANIAVSVVNTTLASARLCTFLDANNDGDFADAGDAIVTTLVSNNATAVVVPLTVPGGTTGGDKPIRFRLMSANPAVNCGIADAVGGVANGEVEDYLFRVGPFDFGDAPDAAAGTASGNYQTTFGDSGPNHVIVSTLRLGAAAPDADDGSLQAVDAAADDITIGDDEDGATALSVATSTAISIPVTVTNSTAGNVGLCVMLDIDGDGLFENTAAERSFQTRAVGTTSTAVGVGTSPATAITTYLRLRVSSQFTAAADCDAQNAIDGEIEDFRFTVGNLDFGDLPTTAVGVLPSYTTNAAAGSVTIAAANTRRLGAVDPDPEAAHQGTALANGDDTANLDDEEGLGQIILASGAATALPITVHNTVAGADLCVFIDWNRDGDFVDANERGFVNAIGNVGTQVQNVNMTAPVMTGPVAARIRISGNVGTAATDCASNAVAPVSGEIEDYILNVGNPDFGDAPDSYGTLLTSNGARHGANGNGVGTTLRLGPNNADTEATGVPGTAANGDDSAGAPDDEDGITTVPTLIQGSANYQLTVTATNDIDATAGICSYLDIDGDGVFEAGEVQFTTIADGVTAGTALVTWPLTSQLVPQGNTYVRIRISTAFTDAPSCSPVGAAPNGEVEDYAITVQSRDFGDLPDAGAGIAASSGGNPPNYRTTLADNGPRHTISASLRLGQVNDADLDGLNSLSTADDVADAVDDEESILSFSRNPGQPTQSAITVNVRATNTSGSAARICFFVDRNADGDFADAGEIGTGAVPNSTTDGSIAVVIPAIGFAPTQPAGTPGIGMRLRIAQESVIGTTCEAAEADGQLTGSGDPALGEVEDYYTGAVNTVPVTLSAVDARSSGTALMVRFLAASEAGTLGYNVWSGTLDGAQRSTVNPSLLISTGNGLKSAEYVASGVLTAGHTQVWIEELDIGGKSTTYGPYAIGVASGDFDLARPIDWRSVGQERSAFSTALALRQRGAGGEAALLAVSTDGWQRVAAGALLEQAPALAGQPIARLSLQRHDSTSAALRVLSSDGTLSADDSVEFYGRAVSDSLYTRTAYYTLGATGDGVMPTVLANGSVAGAPGTSARARIEHRPNRWYGTEIPGIDPWYAARVVRSGANPASVDESFEVPDRVPGSEVLTVLLRGGLDFAGEAPDHQVEILLNGTVLGTTSFDGLAYRELRYALAAGVLRSGANTLTVRLPASTPYSADRVHLEGVQVDYERSLALTAGGRFDVMLTPTTGSSGDLLLADGFEDGVATPVRVAGGSAVLRIDVAASDVANLRFVRLRGAQAELLVGQQIAVDGNGQRHVLLGFDRIETGDRLLGYTLDALGAPVLSPRAETADPLGSAPIDLLVIADAQFSDALAPLVAARQAEGLQVRTVSAQDVLRHFNGDVYDSVAFSRAITQARRNNGVKYVLLVGADSYDYFNYSGLNPVSFIPTPYRATSTYVQQTPVDAVYGDSNGDGLIEVAIGRFPARTVAEAQAMVAKTLAYGQAGHGGKALAISDREQGGYRFADVSEQWAALLPEGWERQSLKLETFSNDATGLAQARSQLYQLLNGGQALTTFYGHSAPGVWARQSLLTQAWLQGNPLDNAQAPTAVVQWGCWGGYVVEPSANSVAQGLLAQSSGAALVLGAAGLTETLSDEVLATRLTPLLGQPGQRFGDALLQAQAQVHLQDASLLDVLLGMTVLGDPTLKVRAP